MSANYETFYPGKYLDWEKKIIEDRLELISKGPPKVIYGPTEPVSKYEIKEFNLKWDPYNPLFNDGEYATRAGHTNIPALPCFKYYADGPAIDLVGIPHNIAEVFYVGQFLFSDLYSSCMFYKFIKYLS